MREEIIDIFEWVKKYVDEMLETLENGNEDVQTFEQRVEGLLSLLDNLKCIIPKKIYVDFEEYFEAFSIFCMKCQEEAFLLQNVNGMADSLELVSECIEEIIHKYKHNVRQCYCCGDDVVYEPLSLYYDIIKQNYGVMWEKYSRTLDAEESFCPACKCSGKNRLIVSFLKKIGLDKEISGVSLLHIAPAKQIEHWIHGHCMTLTYHSTDLCMDTVTFKSDIQKIQHIKDESYDYIVCPHVLDYVQDDKMAMKELCRILKKDGIGIFVQGDCSGQYAKQDKLEQLRENGFCVLELGEDYFGTEIFRQCGLSNTSTLYILSKRGECIDKVIEKRKEKRIADKKQEPLVSVLLPCYNHEQYVEAAIESVLNQTYKNIEFLLVDDGSSDNTPQKILQYKDKVTEIELFEKNTMAAMTFLAKKATGKYVAVMHSDDVWEPTKLEMQVTYLESHPECAACFTGVNLIDDKGRKTSNDIFLQTNMSKEAWIRFFFERDNCLAHPSVMIKRDVYRDLHEKTMPRTFIQLPDFWMWINLVLEKEIHIIEKELVCFRVHEQGYNANTSARNVENATRHMIEIQYIWYHLFRRIDNQKFKEIFGNSFVRKDADTDELIMCEKFFVLLNSKGNSLRQAAIFFIYDLYQIPGMEKVLENEYQWRRMDIKRITGEPPYC